LKASTGTFRFDKLQIPIESYKKRLNRGESSPVAHGIGNDLRFGGCGSALDIFSGRFADSFPDGEVQAPT
jgi:hypothetical protein